MMCKPWKEMLHGIYPQEMSADPRYSSLPFAKDATDTAAPYLRR